MDQYTYFILGIILGLSMAIVYFLNREEKEEKTMMYNQLMFSSTKLNNMLDTVAIKIINKVEEVNRELTEDEKDEIISQCYREKFELAKERR